MLALTLLIDGLLLSTRRSVLFGAATVSITPAFADTGLGYIDDAGMKSYSSVQRAWEKSATMSDQEKFMAARGATRADTSAPESAKSQKRRAMAGCANKEYRTAAGYDSEASCNSRVMGGDVQFMLDVIDQ